MKLGIALLVLFGGDMLLSIILLMAGYDIGGLLAPVRLIIDLVLVLYGIMRIRRARRVRQ